MNSLAEFYHHDVAIVLALVQMGDIFGKINKIRNRNHHDLRNWPRIHSFTW